VYELKVFSSAPAFFMCGKNSEPLGYVAVSPVRPEVASYRAKPLKWQCIVLYSVTFESYLIITRQRMLWKFVEID